MLTETIIITSSIMLTIFYTILLTRFLRHEYKINKRMKIVENFLEIQLPCNKGDHRKYRNLESFVLEFNNRWE